MSKNFCNNIFGFGEVKSDHANAQCIEIELKFQKIVSKSWFIYPIWTIGTYKLPLVGLDSTVKRSNYIKKLAVMFNFCSYPLPWLG